MPRILIPLRPILGVLQDHLAKFHKMTDAKEMRDAIKSRFGCINESKKMQKYILKQQFEGFFVSNSEGLHRGYDRFQSLLSQLKIHGAGVSIEDANQKFLSAQNVAFVSSEKTSSTNDVSTAYGVSTSSGYNSQRENSSSYMMILSHLLENAGQKEIRKAKERCKETLDTKQRTYGMRPRKQEKLKFGKLLMEKELIGLVMQRMSKRTLLWMAIAIQRSDTEMSTRDKSGLGGLSDVEDSLVHDRFTNVEGMHAVPAPMTGNYMPPGPDREVDDSMFTSGPKKSKTSEFDTQTSNFDSCEFNSSVETLESVPEPVVVEPKVVSQPKVWSDAPIIKEYKLDSDDEYVIQPSKEQERPSFAFVNIVKHVKTPSKTVKEQNTYSPSPKADKRD
ncbi:hypothetical protein Tco_1386291 [Tanacetum coccineum]